MGKKEKKYREIGGAKVYRGWKLWEEGEFIEGEFTGDSIDNYGKPNYHIKITDTNIEDENIKIGATIGLNSCGSLDYKMEQNIDHGDHIRVEYEGTVELTKGKFEGKDAHSVAVFVIDPDEVEDQAEENDGEEDGEGDEFSDL